MSKLQKVFLQVVIVCLMLGICVYPSITMAHSLTSKNSLNQGNQHTKPISRWDHPSVIKKLSIMNDGIEGNGTRYFTGSTGTGIPVLPTGNSKTLEQVRNEMYQKYGSPPQMMNAESLIYGKDDRRRVTRTAINSYPERAIVHIETDLSNCTGFFIGPKTVATAGHCVYSSKYNRWAKYAIIIPAADGYVSRYPFTTAKNFHSVSGWVKSENPAYDYGAITTKESVGKQTGSFGVKISSPYYSYNGQKVAVAGYPTDKPYHTMWKAIGTFRSHSQNFLYYDTDIWYGMSGGPAYQTGICEACSLAIHTYSFQNYNAGRRFTSDMYQNYLMWKNNY